MQTLIAALRISLTYSADIFHFAVLENACQNLRQSATEHDFSLNLNNLRETDKSLLQCKLSKYRIRKCTRLERN